MSNIIPPNLSHPGALVREEVEGRGWSLSDLAKIMGRPLQAVSEIVNGKKAITATTAKELGEALGTGAEFWIRLQAMWELSHAAEPSSAIREWHLTPRGWEDGSNQWDCGQEIKDTPVDRVLTRRYHEYMSSSFSATDRFFETVWRDEPARVAALAQQFGEHPKPHYAKYRAG